ncbi:MAG: phage portal protein [Mycobacterium sp.]
MGVIKTLPTRIGAAYKALTSRDQYVEASTRLYEGSGHYGAKPWPFDYNRAVHQCQGWVYRCVIGNAQAAASVPLRMYVRKRTGLQLKAMGLGAPAFERRKVSTVKKKWLRGEYRDHRPSAVVRHKLAEFGDDFEEVTDHPVLNLLRTVNPMMNGFDLATFRLVSLQLTGNAYLHPVMNPSLRRPAEIWPMMSNWTKIVPTKGDDDDAVIGYVYGGDFTREHRFETDEVLHFARDRYIRDPHYGYGPLEAAWSAVGLSYSKRISDKALFDNFARPDYILSVEGAGKDQVERTESRINALRRGVRNVGKALVTNGKARVQTLQFPPKDIGEFNEILEEVAGVFGYPIQKLKAAYEPKANAEVADYSWMKDTINPMLRHDEETLNQGGYLGLFGDGSLLDDAVLAYDDPVPANAEARRLDSSVYVAIGSRTINEDREDMGLPPVEGGDEPRVNGVAISALDAQAEAQVEAVSQPFGAGFTPSPAPTPTPAPSASDIAAQVMAMMQQGKSDQEKPATEAIDHKPESRAKALAKRIRERHDASCAMLMVTGDASDQAFHFNNYDLNPADIAAEGVEVEPHVTIKYGLTTDQFEDVAPVLRAAQPIRVRFGKTAIFEAEEHDVVYVAVESEQLGTLHDQLGELPNTDEHTDYTPHMTLAYVESGKGQQYAGSDQFEGLEAILHTVVFRASNGDSSVVTLRRQPPTGDGDDNPGKNREGSGRDGGGQVLESGHSRNEGGSNKSVSHPKARGVGGDDLGGRSTADSNLGTTDGEGSDISTAGRVKGDRGGADNHAGERDEGSCDDSAGCACGDAEVETSADGEDASQASQPDAAHLPIGFKGYAKAVEGAADDTERDGESETPIQRFARLLAAAFEAQATAALAALGKTKDKAKRRSKRKLTDEELAERRRIALEDTRILTVLESLNEAVLTEAIEQALPPMISAGANAGAEQIGQTMAAAGQDDGRVSVGFDVSNPLVERAARERSIELAGDLNQTTVNRLRDSLADGIAEGETNAQLSERVRTQFDSFTDSRAEQVARTESALAYEQGQQDAWKESGVVAGKQWILAPGACQFCIAVAKEFNGKTVDLDGDFVPKGSTVQGVNGGTMKTDYRAINGPPLHPQCRCDLMPVLGGEFADLAKAIKDDDRQTITKFWRAREAGRQDDLRDEDRDKPGADRPADVPG